MPVRKPPTRSRHPTVLSLLQHDFKDLSKRYSAQERGLAKVQDTLNRHRKEEKDNGKRLDALTGRVDALTGRVDALTKEFRKSREDDRKFRATVLKLLRQR